MHQNSRIYPLKVKPASQINNYSDWPDEVREIIKIWNKEHGLSFLRMSNTFKCQDCQEFCKAHKYGAASFYKTEILCDECLIQRALNGYQPPKRIKASLEKTRSNEPKNKTPKKPNRAEPDLKSEIKKLNQNPLDIEERKQVLKDMESLKPEFPQ